MLAGPSEGWTIIFTYSCMSRCDVRALTEASTFHSAVCAGVRFRQNNDPCISPN